MLKVFNRIWPFTRSNTNTNTSGQTSQSQKGTLSGTLYLTIDELPLDCFIRCTCDGDLKALIITGDHDDMILYTAWESIYEQYVDALKDKDQMYILKLTKKINALEFDIKLIQLCIKRLSVEFSADVLAALKKVIPVPGKFNPDDAEQYAKDLSIAVTRSKSLILEIENKKGELSRVTPKKASEKMDRTAFDALIIRISKYMQFKVDKKKTTVSEFVQMIVDMREVAEAMEMESLKSKHR